MKKKILLAIVGMAIFCSWSMQHSNEIKKVEWLIGTWENKTQRGSIYETWTKVSEVELSGKSYMLKEKDSIIFETIQMLHDQNSSFYIPKVKNKNGDLPVRFTS